MPMAEICSQFISFSHYYGIFISAYNLMGITITIYRYKNVYFILYPLYEILMAMSLCKC